MRYLLIVWSAVLTIAVIGLVVNQYLMGRNIRLIIGVLQQMTAIITGG